VVTAGDDKSVAEASVRKVLVLIWVLMVPVVQSVGVSAQSTSAPPRTRPPAPSSASPAFSPARLARIDSVLQQYVHENRIGGVVALVLRDGQPVYERALGWSDKEAGRRMAADTIFRIASQTKAITSVAVLSLMEEGKIGLSDPVSRFFP
jgi:CubicO group peptidase (beta-lactamase class C family)